MPDFEVIIPTFNPPPARLDAAVRSAVACESAGVIVVDDGSATPAAVDPGWPKRGRVRLIRQANAGPSAARNAGVDASSAPLVLFLDDDDTLIASGVKAMASLLDRLGAVAAIAARYEVREGREPALRPAPLEWAGRTLPGPWSAFRPIPLLGASGLLVSRRAIERGLRFDAGLAIGEDRDLIARLAAIGPVAVSPEPALTVALHAGGANLTSAQHMARRIRDHLTLLDRHLDDKSRDNFREATRWLVNAAAKAGVPDGEWAELAVACRRVGVRVPLKARWRRWRHPTGS
jgi:GT2 family glycosyltransferase